MEKKSVVRKGDGSSETYLVNDPRWWEEDGLYHCRINPMSETVAVNFSKKPESEPGGKLPGCPVVWLSNRHVEDIVRMWTNPDQKSHEATWNFETFCNTLSIILRSLFPGSYEISSRSIEPMDEGIKSYFFLATPECDHPEATYLAVIEDEAGNIKVSDPYSERGESEFHKKDSAPTYGQGDVISIEGQPYLLARTGTGQINLFNLRTGNKWGKPMEVESTLKVTHEELQRLVGGYEFTKEKADAKG